MTVTLKDIAIKSGVSIGTVNRALKNNGRISQETQDRILAIAHEMNYIPNRAAQALVKQKPLFTIGFIFNGMQNRFYDKLMIGIELIQQKYTSSELTLKLKPIQDFSVNAQLEALDELLASKVDGLIIVPIPHIDITYRLNQLIENKFPVVIIDEPTTNLAPLSYVYGNFFATFNKIIRLAELIGQASSHVTILDQSYLRSTNFSFFERFYSALSTMTTKQTYTLLPVTQPNPGPYYWIFDDLQKNPLSDIIICGGSPQIIRSLLKYKTDVNPNVKVIALDYEYIKVSINEEHLEKTHEQQQQQEKALNQLVSFSLNQNTDQFSSRAIQLLFDYLSKQILPSTEIITIDSQITINESTESNILL